MSGILDNIFILVLTINSKILLLVAFVKYTLSQLSFGTFCKLHKSSMGQNIAQTLLICVYLLCPKNHRNGSKRLS